MKKKIIIDRLITVVLGIVGFALFGVSIHFMMNSISAMEIVGLYRQETELSIHYSDLALKYSMGGFIAFTGMFVWNFLKKIGK